MEENLELWLVSSFRCDLYLCLRLEPPENIPVDFGSGCWLRICQIVDCRDIDAFQALDLGSGDVGYKGEMPSFSEDLLRVIRPSVKGRTIRRVRWAIYRPVFLKIQKG